MGAPEAKSPEHYFHQWKNWGAAGRSLGRVIDVCRVAMGSTASAYANLGPEEIAEQPHATEALVGERALVGAAQE